jgi:hypothetical protein
MGQRQLLSIYNLYHIARYDNEPGKIRPSSLVFPCTDDTDVDSYRRTTKDIVKALLCVDKHELK